MTETLEQKILRLEKSLNAIANLMPYPGQCGQPADMVYGINDGKHRGILLKGALDISRKALDPEFVPEPYSN